MTNKKQILTTVLSVLVSVFLVASIAYAVTTVSGTTITLENSATIANSTAGQIEVAGLSSPAAGANGLYVVNTLATAANLTGEIIGGRFAANSNENDTSASGSVKGVMSQARACVPDGTPGTVFELAAFYGSADAKDSTGVSYLRGMEVSLDGLAGSAATLAQGVLISNNSSGVQTTSYALDINSGTAVAHKAFTADIRLQNGETIDNATDGIIGLGSLTAPSKVLVTAQRMLDVPATDENDDEQFLMIQGYFSGLGAPTGVGYSADRSSNTQALYIEAARTEDTLIGDLNDMGLKIRISNYATGSVAGYYMRGMDVEATNKSSGAITGLYGANITAYANGTGGVSDQYGLKVESKVNQAVTTSNVGLYVRMYRQAATVPTSEYAVKIVNDGTIDQHINAGIYMSSVDANNGYYYGIDMSGATVGTADIRLSSGALIKSGTPPSEDDTCTVKGSLFLGNDGTLWSCNAALDWTLVTATATD